MTFKDVMRRYFERFAYQTRHGTEAGADLVFAEALQQIAIESTCAVVGCRHPGCSHAIPSDSGG